MGNVFVGSWVVWIPWKCDIVVCFKQLKSTKLPNHEKTTSYLNVEFLCACLKQESFRSLPASESQIWHPLLFLVLVACILHSAYVCVGFRWRKRTGTGTDRASINSPGDFQRAGRQLVHKSCCCCTPVQTMVMNVCVYIYTCIYINWNCVKDLNCMDISILSRKLVVAISSSASQIYMYQCLNYVVQWLWSSRQYLSTVYLSTYSVEHVADALSHIKATFWAMDSGQQSTCPLAKRERKPWHKDKEIASPW